MKISAGIQFSRGINLFNRPRDLEDGELVRSKNLYPKFPGKLATRPSSVRWPVLTPYALGANTPIGMHFLPVTAPAWLVLFQRGALYGTPTFMSVYQDPSSSVPVASSSFGCVTRYVPASIAYQDRLYAFGGPDSNCNGKILQKNAVSGLLEIVDLAFSTAGNVNLRPAVVGIYQDRFAYANLGPGFESALVFADRLNPAAIVANALTGDYLLINPNDGDRIVGLVELLQTGGAPANASFLVLKEFSSYLLTGQSLRSDGSGTDTLRVNRMPVNAGCASSNTICVTPFGTLWAGPDDVWIFPEGQLPYRVGTKISPVLKGDAPNVRYRWHAVFHDGFYKLALHAPGQGAGDDDACGEQYWLDLRSGPPQSWKDAQWWGPQIFTIATGDASPSPQSRLGTQCMAVDSRPGSNRQLWSADTPIPSSGAYTTLLSLDGSASHDYVDATGSTLEYPNRWDYSYDPQGLEINTEIITREISTLSTQQGMVADATQEKGLHGAEVDLHTSMNGLLAWYWILNGGTTMSAEQTAEMLRQGGFALGAGALDVNRLATEDIPVALDPAPSRVVGRTIQLKIANKPGYYVDSTNDFFEMDVEVSAGVFVHYSASLTHGYYTDSDALAAHISIKMGAAMPGKLFVLFAAAGTFIMTLRILVGGISIRFGSTWATINQAKTRIIANLLGFTAFDSGGYSGASSLQATEGVWLKECPLLEFDGLVLHFYTIPRRTL